VVASGTLCRQVMGPRDCNLVREARGQHLDAHDLAVANEILLGRLLNLKCSECGGKRDQYETRLERGATTGARSGQRYDLKRLRVKASLAAALFPVCVACHMRSRQGLP
jgi:hypothetical protein